MISILQSIQKSIQKSQSNIRWSNIIMWFLFFRFFIALVTNQAVNSEVTKFIIFERQIDTSVVDQQGQWTSMGEHAHGNWCVVFFVKELFQIGKVLRIKWYYVYIFIDRLMFTVSREAILRQLVLVFKSRRVHHELIFQLTEILSTLLSLLI